MRRFIASAAALLVAGAAAFAVFAANPVTFACFVNSITYGFMV